MTITNAITITMRTLYTNIRRFPRFAAAVFAFYIGIGIIVGITSRPLIGLALTIGALLCDIITFVVLQFYPSILARYRAAADAFYSYPLPYSTGYSLIGDEDFIGEDEEDEEDEEPSSMEEEDFHEIGG